MGNKKTQKVRRAAGTNRKTRSKGTGHNHPNPMLDADWLISENHFQTVFWHFYVIQFIFDQSKCTKNYIWPKILQERVNKYVNPMMTPLLGISTVPCPNHGIGFWRFKSALSRNFISMMHRSCNIAFLLMTHNLWLIIHDTSFMTHPLWLIIHDSSFMTHHLWLIIHDSSFMTHYLWLIWFIFYK